MTTPPDFGGHEIEEGLLEDLGGPAEEPLEKVELHAEEPAHA